MRFAASLAISALLLVACGDHLSVEQKIIANLRSMEAAAEEGEHLEFMTHVTESFQGQYGDMDRRAFHRFMIFQMNQNRRLQAQFFSIRVQQPNLDQTQANFNLLVTGGGGLLPESGQFFDVKTHWQLSDGDWVLNAADWEVSRMPMINQSEN